MMWKSNHLLSVCLLGVPTISGFTAPRINRGLPFDVASQLLPSTYLKSSITEDSFSFVDNKTEDHTSGLDFQKLALVSAMSAATVAAGMTMIPHTTDMMTDTITTIQRIPMDIWHAYEHILRSAPIPTKAATSATVYGIGDVIAQNTEGKVELDVGRTTRSVFAGLIGHGPLSHFWYNFCDGLFENTLHMTAWWTFAPKIAVDQFLWGPIWTSIYIFQLGVMKLDSPESILFDIRRSTIPMLVSGLKLWPLAHCVTYGFIPVENRLLFVDIVEIFWVSILATQAATSPQVEDGHNDN